MDMNEGVQVRVRIEGSYENGHSYDRVVVVDAPDPVYGPDEDWWWDVVFPETGDGQPGDIGSYCKATVLDPEELWGTATYEWTD